MNVDFEEYNKIKSDIKSVRYLLERKIATIAGSMLTSVYDPNNIAADVFSMGNMNSVGTWRTFYSNGTKDVNELALGAANKALISQGLAAAPTWGGHDDLDGFVANEHIDWTNASSNFSTSGTLISDKATFYASSSAGQILVLGTNDKNRSLTLNAPADGDNTAAFIFNTFNSIEFQVDSASVILLRDTKDIAFGASTMLATGGETAPDVTDGGLCLNQGAADANILTFKSSDVGHGLTSIAETDTYVEFLKYVADNGGLQINVISDATAAGTQSFGISVYQQNAADTNFDYNTARGVFEINVALHDGANNVSNVAEAGNMFAIRMNGNTWWRMYGNGNTAHLPSQTMTVGTADGYCAFVKPRIAGAYTMTRFNYFNLDTPTLSSATLTDAAVFRFPAAAGTHKAVASGSTKTSPGTVSAWVKININGTLYYMPAYTSRTS